MSTEPRWTRIKRHIRRRFDDLKNEQASPEKLGMAVALGVFCGLSPLLGLQTLLALGLAWLLRLNKLAVLIGLQISAPPFTPFVVLAEIELGELILHGKALPLTLASVRATPGRVLLETFFIDLSVGGVTLGIVVGAALGAATTAWIRRRRAARGPAAVDELAQGDGPKLPRL